jgi:MarR family transcriptional regulator, lower aerobic nicotinate degradation pathway regulator
MDAMASAPTASAEAACGVLLLRLARATSRRLTSALESLGMSGHEFAALNILRESGPLSQQQLSEGLRVHPSNLVGLIDALESDGLVGRTRDPADRRRHIVGLTPAGIRRLGQAQRAAIDAEAELLAPLSAAERAELASYLRRLTAHSCGMRGCAK